MNRSNHYRIHWKARSIELQDIDLPFERVLVGLKFENVTKDGVDRLRLVALSESFNYTTGKIIPNGKEFYENRTEPSRYKLRVINF